jgi:outer membrane cobalamin receptor
VYSYNIPGVNYSIASGARGNFAQQGLLTGISFNKTVHEKFKLMSYFAYDYHQRDWAANDGAHDILYLKNERFQASFKANWRINESLSLDFGLEAEYGTGTHQQLNALKDTLLQLNMPKGKIIRNESVFAQFRYQLAKLELTAGSRIVHNNTFNKLQANRLSLLYKISARKSLKFVYGQAFRSPSMLELYFDHPTVVGNINLKPEFVNSYEIVFSATQGNFFGQLTGYYSKYSNLIQRISPQIDQPSEYINVGAINTVGIELEAKWQLPSNFSAFINYNLMQGTDAISDSNFNLIPDHTITAGIHKMLGKWSAGIYSYACSNTQGVLHNIAPQYFIDLNLDYSHKYRGGRITHALIVKNLTNSNMLIPQYIRASKNINEIPTMAYGIRAIYSLTFSI